MTPSAPDRTKPPCERDDAVFVVSRLREAGHVAYFAGGCVRDLLLGMDPKDYDVATDAPPARVRSLFPNTQAVGAAFGVILVRRGRSVVEVATFRADGAYQDGRRPSSVRFTTAEEDARRRDFTLNGLFLDPVDGRVIDYVGGQDDLRAGRIRAIGTPAERFEEDSLRLLRAVRFSARFGFPIEPDTAGAIRAHAPQLKRVSPERIADELRAMLTAPTRPAAWAMLWDLGLAPEILRFLPGSGPNPSRSALFPHLAPGRPVAFGLALAAAIVCHAVRQRGVADVRPLFAHREVQSAVRAMRQALKISNDESDALAGTLEGLAPLLADDYPPVARLKRFLARPTASLSRELLAALRSAGLHAERVAALQASLEELQKTDYAPAPLLTGDDLTAAGLAPGPVFKRVLDEVYDAQLEGKIETRQAALTMGLALAGTTG